MFFPVAPCRRRRAKRLRTIRLRKPQVVKRPRSSADSMTNRTIRQIGYIRFDPEYANGDNTARSFKTIKNEERSLAKDSRLLFIFGIDHFQIAGMLDIKPQPAERACREHACPRLIRVPAGHPAAEEQWRLLAWASPHPPTQRPRSASPNQWKQERQTIGARRMPPQSLPKVAELSREVSRLVLGFARNSLDSHLLINSPSAEPHSATTAFCSRRLCKMGDRFSSSRQNDDRVMLSTQA